MTDFTPRRENLIRAMAPGDSTVSEDGKTLFGHFARFNEWNRIDSAIEGTFLERIAPGAFTKTFQERTPKILFNHGKDPAIGDKVIASSRSFGEDETGPTLDGELLDGLDPLLVSGLRAGAYGMSYRFSIPNGKDEWNRSAKIAAHNPQGLPERTIREAMVYEAGPVTWPADPGTNAGVRSLTDAYTLDTLAADPERLASLIEAKLALDPQEPAPATPERAAEPVAQPPESPKETTSVADKEYTSPEDKEARASELRTALTRMGEDFTGVLPVEQQARWDADTAELAKLEADIAAFNQRQSFLRTIADKPGNVQPGSAPAVIKSRTADDIYNLDQFSGIGFRSVEERDQTIRENALRSIDSQRTAKSLEHLADLVENHDEGVTDSGERASGALARRIIATGSPVYKRAFAKYLRHGNTMAFTPEEQRAAIAVVGTTTTGGYAVPYIFDPTMYHTGVWTAENPFRKACRTVEITNGNNWRTVTVGAITSDYATEALAASENAPAFGQPTYTVQRAQAFATVSIETLEDRSDITSELTSVFAESKDTLEENKFAVGSGATVYPLGMFTDTAYTNQDTATNDVTALADLLVLEGALPLRYRANAAFFMNRSTLRQLMALDTTYRYFTGAGIQFAGQNQPSGNGGGNTGISCLGYPVWEVPSAVSTLTTDGAIIVVFCDPKSYIIVDRIGMNVEVIPTMLNGATPSFPTGQRGIYVYWRNTAKPIAADAGRSLSVQ